MSTVEILIATLLMLAREAPELIELITQLVGALKGGSDISKRVEDILSETSAADKMLLQVHVKAIHNHIQQLMDR